MNDCYMKRIAVAVAAACTFGSAFAADKTIPPNEQRVPLIEQRDAGSHSNVGPLLAIAALVGIAIVISRNRQGEPDKQALVGPDPETGVPGVRFQAKF